MDSLNHLNGPLSVKVTNRAQNKPLPRRRCVSKRPKG